MDETPPSGPDDADRDGAEERTVIRPRRTGAPATPTSPLSFLPVAAAPPIAAAAPGHVLPVGTRLLDYEITGLIGEGGFGIVYLAWDHSLQRKVAVKEYMPASLVSRAAGSSAIVVKSDRHLDTFRAGLKSFVNEARLLARFDHRALVKVYRFWEENGTAYMVMPFYEGPTLKSALAALGHVPDEEEIRRWLMPLLDALAVMHAAQCFHRDIAPDNILLTPTGPLLLDFGAARRVIGDMTHALTVVLKPGYAPIEQYGDVASMTQGPWTDLYALACVVYYAITGRTPTSSVERLMDDRLAPLKGSTPGPYAPAFLHAIDAALALRPQDRPQNERAFRALLDEGRPVRTTGFDSGAMPFADSSAAPFPNTQQPVDSTVPGTRTPEIATQLQTRIEARAVPLEPIEKTAWMPPPSPPPVVTAPTAAAVPKPVDAPRPKVTVARPAPVAPAPAPAMAAPAVPVAPPTRAPKPRSRAPVAVFVGVLAVLVGGAAWWSLAGRPAEPSPAAAIETPTSPAASVVPGKPLVSDAVAPAASGAASEVATPPSVAAPVPAEATASSPPPPTAASVRPEPMAAVPRTTRPVAVPREPRAATPSSVEPAVPRRAAGGRCSDILQKGSLEPLSAEEAAYLKRECR